MTPAFNENATKEPNTPGRIRRWQFLTGQATDPRAIDLNMSEPITISIPESGGNESLSAPARSGSMTWEYTIPEDVERRGMALTYMTQQTGDDPDVTLTVTGPARGGGTETTTEPMSVATAGTIREGFDLDEFEPGSTVTVQVDSRHVATRLEISERVDSDGDGIWDEWEERIYQYPYPVRASGEFQRFSTSPTDPDTDGDGIPDGEEYSVSWHEGADGEAYLQADPETHPTVADTDGDGIEDGRERRGWNVSVVERNGQPYRWAPASSNANGTLHVTSDPLVADTDYDGLTDGQERNETHTDPRAVQTYTITADHEDVLHRAFQGEQTPMSIYLRFQMGLGPKRLESLSIENLENPDLTDGSDDFDIVTHPSSDATLLPLPERLDQLTFTALSGNVRADYWLSNRREVTHFRSRSDIPEGKGGYRYDLSPWDPDTDNDGLTDGQEISGTQTGRFFTMGTTYETDPTNPDTDGDGYWDGWIGVYGVNITQDGIDYADNVVLYREHLQSGNGIESGEIVQEQIGVHEEDAAPLAGGADIDNDGAREHSNVHVGELQWGTDPTTIDEFPELGFNVEVDFVQGGPNTLNTPAWERGIEQNFQLYGMSVNIIRDDTISGDPVAGVLQTYAWRNNLQTDLHLIVGTQPPQWGWLPSKVRNAWGFNEEAAAINLPGVASNGMIIWEHQISQVAATSVTTRDLTHSPYQLSQSVVAGKVTMHEIGHSLGVGEADDRDPWGDDIPVPIVGNPIELPFTEVYSGERGSNDDPTPERIVVRGRPVREWSIMRFGWSSRTLIYHRDTGYYTHSIEELLTIEEVDSG